MTSTACTEYACNSLLLMNAGERCFMLFGFDSCFSLHFNKTLVEIFSKLYFVLLRSTYLSDCISISSISVIPLWSLVLSSIGSCHAMMLLGLF